MRNSERQARKQEPIRKVMRKSLQSRTQAGRKPNFASIEDLPNAEKKIRSLATAAVRKAAVENRRLGLSSIVIRRNQVISIDSQKKEEVIATIQESANKYRPGQVFHARKS